MIDYSFIRLEDTLDKAHDLGESPEVKRSILRQIQLIPEDPKPYYQTTNKTGGVTIGSNAQAFLVDCSGNEDDITPYFLHEDLTDADNDTQIIFRLAYLPKDYWSDEVYLKITSDASEVYYSNKFLVTNDDCHKTARIDYVDPRGLVPTSTEFIDKYQSIRLAFYRQNYIDGGEITTQLQTTTEQYVNLRSRALTFSEWYFRMVNWWTWTRLKNIVYNTEYYIDFERNQSPPDGGFEWAKRSGTTNYSLEQTFITDPDPDDTITVEDVIIIIPDEFNNFVFMDGNNFTTVDNNNLVFIQ